MTVAPDGSPVELYLLLPAAALAEAGLRFDRWLDPDRGSFTARADEAPR